MEIEYIYNPINDSYEVNKVSSLNKTILIPREYNGKPISKLNKGSFNEAKYAEEVLLPDTLIEIDENNFSSLCNLTVAFFYGEFCNLNNIKIERGNSNLLLSIANIAEDKEIFNALNNLLHDKIPLSILINDMYCIESIHHLRAQVALWAYEKGLRVYWMNCDELYITEDDCDYSLPKDFDLIALDSYDEQEDAEYQRHIRNIIYRSIIEEIPIVGLAINYDGNDDYFQTRVVI